MQRPVVLMAMAMAVATGVPALAAPPSGGPSVNVDAPAPPACLVAFRSSWSSLDFVVGVDRVRGSGVTLTRHGQVISGFLFGAVTRVHHSGNRLSGVVAGGSTTIHIEAGKGLVTLRGELPGLGKATIVSDAGKLSVFSDGVALSMTRQEPGLLRGDLKAGDRFSEVSLRLSDCSSQLLVSRPELLLALALAPLVR